MTIVAHPRLGPTGWTSSLAEKADGLLADFFSTDSNQSPPFLGKMTSLVDIVRSYFTQPVHLVNEITRQLESYLLRYYPQGAVIDATSPATSPSYAGGPYTVTIRMLVTEEGIQYNLGYLVTLTDSTAIKIAQINNTGE